MKQQDQTNYLEGRQLILACIALNAANGVAFTDLVGVPNLLSTIAIELDAGNTISWAVTASLVASTIGQCLLGYLSDILGRKRMILSALTILTVASLLAALSAVPNSSILYYVARAIAGLATGSISNLVNIAQNDFLPTGKRELYQGIQGISVAVGSLTGSFVGAALITANGGYWYFLHIAIAILALVTGMIVWLCVPSRVPWPTWKETREQARTVDWSGIGLGAVAVATAAVALTEGPNFGWGSASTISLSAAAGVSTVLFVCIGSRTLRAKIGLREKRSRAIIPFTLFHNRTIFTIYMQNMLFGAVYWAFMEFMPYYWQVVRRKQILVSAAFMAPYIVAHGIVSTSAGQVTGRLIRRGRRSWSLSLWFGFSCWSLAMVLLAAFGETWPPIAICFVQVLVGFGSGCTFQVSVNAIRTQVTKEENAVAIGARNVLRFFGGAWGTALFSCLMKVWLKQDLPKHLRSLAKSTFSKPKIELYSPEDQDEIMTAYSVTISKSWYVCFGIIFVCVLLCPVLKDQPTKKVEDEEARASDSDTDDALCAHLSVMKADLGADCQSSGGSTSSSEKSWKETGIGDATRG
ncbi:MFS general substrate transporter [Teratosphaeria nubilosa]|uniref:MFS general substrate transporter n=1 Tax=Teratosphaeria nubilosa TaxID=161662 RepID=A0A6G1LME5_9PEZI|nr:MFS general substrate transporter [Teratosphaeria nubilosa]